jgi:hypothetical protein
MDRPIETKWGVMPLGNVLLLVLNGTPVEDLEPDPAPAPTPGGLTHG